MSILNVIIMNSIKKYIPIFLTFLLLAGCFQESNLDLEPFNDTEADIFDKESDFEDALLGTYSKVTDFYVYNANGFIHALWLLPGDDLTLDGGSSSYEVFHTLQPGDGTLSRFFTLIYQLVSRTNTNLSKIAVDEESTESAFSNTSNRDYIKGENLFLRGYANFLLWNYYGTAPVITERITNSDDIKQESSDGIQLLDQAIADFTEAAKLLPTEWNATNRGRATKNSAYGLLGKSLVFKASWTKESTYYTQAITELNKISGRSLVADYGDNFATAAENNSESLYEAQAGQASGTDNVWLANDAFSVVGSWSAYYGYFDNHWSNYSGVPYVATDKLIDAIDPDDPRLDYIVDPSTHRIRKYMVDNVKTNTGVSSINNPRIMRLADAILLKAEALNETGDQDGAIGLINDIRTRARDMAATGVPANRDLGASQAQVRQWIMDERFVEFAAEEGQRWLDLRRWHKAGFIDLSSWDFDSSVATFEIEMPKHLLFPIPNSETNLNSNVSQNEGY